MRVRDFKLRHDQVVSVDMDGNVSIVGKCNSSGKVVTVRDINMLQVYEFIGGKKVQDAFPNLSADDREFLLNSTTENFDEV